MEYQILIQVTLNNILTRNLEDISICILIYSYFCRFKWVHLSERVAYERAVRKHRMRMEISQAKREATDFSLKVDLSEKIKARILKGDSQPDFKMPQKLPPQKKTEEYYTQKRKQKGLKDRQDDGAALLHSLFSSGEEKRTTLINNKTFIVKQNSCYNNQKFKKKILI